MLISRGGDGALEALVIASPRFADALPTAVAVILLFDPRADAEDPAVALAARYDLSFEQAQVVGHLLRGRSIPEVATELGVPTRGDLLLSRRDLPAGRHHPPGRARQAPARRSAATRRGLNVTAERAASGAAARARRERLLSRQADRRRRSARASRSALRA